MTLEQPQDQAPLPNEDNSDINVTQPEKPVNTTDAITALLEGGNPEPSESLETTDEGESLDNSEPVEIQEEASTPKTFNDIAEKLGMETKDLYDLTVTQANGESHTIGEMKDMMNSESDFSRRELEISESKVTHDNAMMRDKQQLEVILRAIPKDALNPALLSQANAELEEHLERETSRTLKAIPSWSEPTAKEADLQAMAEHMKDYGYSRAELDRLIDHRMVKFIRDSMQRADRMKTALGDVKEVKPLPKGQRPSSRAKAPKLKRVPKTESERNSAIAQLIS